MSKRRMIDRKIRTSQTFAKLTYRQRDLWQGLIEVADDQGRMPGRPAYVRSIVWAYDDITLADVSADLQVLEDAGNIMRYFVDGSEYIQLVNWHVYQEGATWLAQSDYPAPDGWQDRCRYHGKNNEIITQNWNTPDKSLPSALPSTLPKREGDVNGEVNSDVDTDDESEDKAQENESTPFKIIQTHIEQLTGLPAQPQSIKAIEEIVTFGGSPGDIDAGYQWLRDQGKLFKYYGQLVGPTRTAMAQRLGKNGNGHRAKVELRDTPEARSKYAEWEQDGSNIEDGDV